LTLQTLGKFIAGICAVLFIITGVMALVLFNIERKAFSSTTYKQAFENQNLYARMPPFWQTHYPQPLLRTKMCQHS